MPPAPPVTTTTWPAAFIERLSWGRLSGLGPAFREGERAGAEGPAFALPRPGPAGGLDAVARKPRAERRYQNRAHAVGPVRCRIRLSVDHQGLADPIPGEAGLVVPRCHALGPESPD